MSNNAKASSLLAQREQVIKTIDKHMGGIDANYYKKLPRLERLARLVKQFAQPGDHLLDLGSGAFVLECILEELGFQNLTAVDLDGRLQPCFEDLKQKGLLKHTTFCQQSISAYHPPQLQDFIILYDCLYYPNNNLMDMLPRLAGSLRDGGYLFFDVYDQLIYSPIKKVYSLLRKNYRNRNAYSLNELNDALQQNGFEIIQVNVELGPKNAFVRLILSAMYRVTRKALAVNYLVRKKAV